ncbi:hotdog fold thioesterase [Liquorilactobacillus satsumensis]|uniref:Thioesterase domain-containing protein n=1 Tax=Liquorilactobacillus satsumensis DSM 16230 = JCM 12392 TaxID=1423801 RepID=A0A0R1UVV5_9LACO|nr:hotdog fold thioesterase [Liquorilactobacillus satsumensis]KRL96836.1 hypothetical protein FD50_GL002119 [Liquorilactobacillus satsumensis DSM 16230 = JCM 12392]MCP9328942.1 hotdog fold thioesterase [Liquorilactobacillus satsumensis]
MNLLETLDIETESVSAAQAVITVTVREKLKQPYGLVHGGINAILAETAASLAANAGAPAGQIAVGVSLNTNHLLPVSTGSLRAVASPLHLGKKTQVWQVKTTQLPSNQVTSFSIVTLILQQIPE